MVEGDIGRIPAVGDEAGEAGAPPTPGRGAGAGVLGAGTTPGRGAGAGTGAGDTVPPGRGIKDERPGINDATWLAMLEGNVGRIPAAGGRAGVVATPGRGTAGRGAAGVNAPGRGTGATGAMAGRGTGATGATIGRGTGATWAGKPIGRGGEATGAGDTPTLGRGTVPAKPGEVEPAGRAKPGEGGMAAALVSATRRGRRVVGCMVLRSYCWAGWRE
jgi:hypothetical protein